MKKVIVRAPALSQSGYGEHARFILRALRSKPELFDVYLLNIPWGQTSWLWEDDEERRWLDSIIEKTVMYGQAGGQFDVSLQVTIPNEWQRIAPVNIGVTAGIETTKISPQWVQNSLQMDKIILTSEHAKYGFDNTEVPAFDQSTGQEVTAKVNIPLEVIGYPVKDVESAEIDIDLKHDFNFLFVGTWITRKNFENTVKWFVEEFYDQEVGLVVKTTMSKNCLRDRDFVEAKLKVLLEEYEGRKCSVNLIHGDMSEEEMTGLYNHPKIKAMVNIAHGEGFALPLFEAAYNGLPIVTTSWSGHTDFLYMPIKDKKGKSRRTPMFQVVSYDIRPVQKEAVWDGVIQKDAQWCFAKEWSYKKALRTTFKEHGAAISKAKKLQEWVKDEFSEDKQYEKIAEVVCPNHKEMDSSIEEMFLQLENK